MNKIMLILIGSLFIAMKSFSQDPNFNISLCFGQSNMEGSAAIENQDKTVDDRFQVLQSLDCPELGRRYAAAMLSLME
jgi:hypothetical protein